MKKVETMWNNLIASETATEEQKIIEQVNKYLTGKAIYFNVRALNNQGKEIGIDKISENSDVVIKAIFTEGDNSFKAPDWTPRNSNNAYILFRE